MSVDVNIGLTPPPLATPITGDSHDEFGVPFPFRGAPLASGTLSVPWEAWFNSLQVRVSALPAIQDTHAHRTNYAAGQYRGLLYYETDRTLVYISQLVSTAWTWVYLSGTVIVANLAALPGSLGTADAGLLAWDSALQHLYRWSGSAWAFAPGDDHLAGQIMPSAGGTTPLGGAWQVCDGSAVTVSKGDGTTVTITTPILNGDTFIKGSAAQTAVNAATNGTLTGSTDLEASHTHGVNINSGGNSAGGSAALAVGSALALNPHIHSVVGNTGAGTAHSHTLTSAAVTPSEPQNIGLVFWMRR